MKKKLISVIMVTLIISFVSTSLPAIDLEHSRNNVASLSEDLFVSIRLIGSKGTVFKKGENVKLTFQTNKDAYLIIYNIDSDGYINLLFPEDGRLRKVEGNRVYFLPDQSKGIYWQIGGKTGIEYIHALAVTNPGMIKEEELYFLSENKRLPEEKRFYIEMDPFLAFNMINEELLVETSQEQPATDYTYFYIDRKVDYPRYLCAKCHGRDDDLDPYGEQCPEIIIEKAAYEEDLSYPYPALFEIEHIQEDTGSDYTYNRDNNDNRLGLEEDRYYRDDQDIYLSFYINDRGYYPYYYPTYHYYYYDPFYWDWGWSIGFSWYWHSWHFDPWYNWYYPGWWYGHRRHWYCHYYNDYYWYNRRPIYANRRAVRRAVSYRNTYARLKQKESLDKTRLAKRRSRTVDRKIATSSLYRRVTKSRLTKDNTINRRSVYTKSRNIERRVVHGSNTSRINARKAKTATRATRNTRSTSKARSTKSTRSVRTPSRTSNTRSKTIEKEPRRTTGNSSSSKRTINNRSVRKESKTSSNNRTRTINRRTSSSRSSSPQRTSSRSTSRSRGSSRSSSSNSRSSSRSRRK